MLLIYLPYYFLHYLFNTPFYQGVANSLNYLPQSFNHHINAAHGFNHFYRRHNLPTLIHSRRHYSTDESSSTPDSVVADIAAADKLTAKAARDIIVEEFKALVKDTGKNDYIETVFTPYDGQSSVYPHWT